MTPRDLICRMQAEPFRPFRIHLADGAAIDVTRPHMIVGQTRAVVATAWAPCGSGYWFAKHWRTVALADMVRLDGVDGKSAG